MGYLFNIASPKFTFFLVEILMQKRKKKMTKFRSFRPQISILSAINKDTDALGVR